MVHELEVAKLSKVEGSFQLVVTSQKYMIVRPRSQGLHMRVAHCTGTNTVDKPSASKLTHLL